MSLKGKIPPELKIQAVEDYLAIRKGSTEIIKELGIRRIATRYDKSNASFPAVVYLASISILLLSHNLRLFSNKP